MSAPIPKVALVINERGDLIAVHTDAEIAVHWVCQLFPPGHAERVYCPANKPDAALVEKLIAGLPYDLVPIPADAAPPVRLAVDNDAPQKCRFCGCTDARACAGGCYWVEPDLCSQCAARLEGSS